MYSKEPAMIRDVWDREIVCMLRGMLMKLYIYNLYNKEG